MVGKRSRKPWTGHTVGFDSSTLRPDSCLCGDGGDGSAAPTAALHQRCGFVREADRVTTLGRHEVVADDPPPVPTDENPRPAA